MNTKNSTIALNILEGIYYGLISALIEAQGYPATEKLLTEAKKNIPIIPNGFYRN
ncbi:MAG: hypothetical protein IPM85_15040 [Chitinophagaceae bacterium]|nr:hypothetical protein [Chitinophagaceae bacterium]